MTMAACVELYGHRGRAMDFMFYVVPGLISSVALFMAYRVIRRSLELRRAWNSGLTAEARCLRTYTSTRAGSDDSSMRTTLHHVYEFTARDGRVVRFEEQGGPGTTIEGDIVVVHYADGETVKATAHAPSHAKNAASTLGILAFVAVIVVFSISFMVSFTEAFASDDPFAGMP
ncbi:DUF3592 domain-containing protein [Streptomyces vastus]|uniref:DUF3592 domain-containing protein n=1 Tax=Streptomyces vastus TaxID=285451 RepID=A0ABN3QDE2_9ACTN